MKNFKEFISEESIKEIPYDKILKMIKDGYWESEQDVVKGKLITIRTGKKKMMVRVGRKPAMISIKESIDESALSPETKKQISDFLAHSKGLSPELIKAGVDALVKALEKPKKGKK